jgi:sigma-B regulation protein RsbQ
LDLQRRNNVHVTANTGPTLVFAHGFGCDKNMWRFLTPAFTPDWRAVLFDHVGSGNSDMSAYNAIKYNSLQGYADDLVEVIQEFSAEPVIFIGHSVSTMIGLLAHLRSPESFRAHVMVAPSACYLNDGGYRGGFERADIDSLLATLAVNYLGWSSSMAPVIMGAPGQPELTTELTNSFCRNDPEVARQFARVTFLADNRADVPKLTAPTLVLQSTDDLIAPLSAGEFIRAALPQGTLALIENTGHCPHMSQPGQCIDAISAFMRSLDG